MAQGKLSWQTQTFEMIFFKLVPLLITSCQGSSELDYAIQIKNKIAAQTFPAVTPSNII